MAAQDEGAPVDSAFRLMIENIRDYAIFMLDPEGRVATWNAGAQAFKGYEAHEIIGRHFSVFYPPADVEAGKCERELAGAVRDGRFEDEGWRIRKDGTRFWANVIITPIISGGALIGFGKVTRDLTERRAAEERRRADEERFALMISSVKDYALLILDHTGIVTTWNAGAERIKGYTASEIIGSHFSRFYPEEDVRAGKCERELKVAAEEGRFEDEGWRIRKDGTRFWANVVITAVRNAMGELVAFAKVTRDLTERRRSEEAMAARLAAEEANRTKDEFLAMLGHELRNPLAPIVSALQLLKLRGDSKSAREHEVIERQVKQMSRLVDDLLDVSRISRGTVVLKREPCDLRDALANGAEIAIPTFDRKGQQFEVVVPDHPLHIDGDEARLTQVFANLLNNAGKYTPDGGRIRLSVHRNDGEVVVEVRDTGVGISPSLLPRVFELFVQGYQEPARAEGGLGIGLTLVRSLVELHGGSVEARSNAPDPGSAFIVRLPSLEDSNHVAPRARPAVMPRSSRQRRVLLVDDNPDARVLLAELLQAFGHEVQSAGDADGALRIVQGFTPDVAILDIGLPGIDGYELARRLRRIPALHGIRLLALTGYGQPADAECAKAAGFDEHLVKPLDIHSVLAHVVAL